MASGRLGAAALTAATDVVAYTVPANTTATLNIGVVNRGTEVATINVALSTAGTPGVADYIEYGVQLPPGGVLERCGLVGSAGEKVFVRASTADCSVRVHGFEEVN